MSAVAAPPAISQPVGAVSVALMTGQLADLATAWLHSLVSAPNEILSPEAGSLAVIFAGL